MPKKKSSAVRNVAPVMHIYCEGEKTEPYYIKKYLDDKFPGNRRRNVIRVEPTQKNTPVQLVDVAVAHKKKRDCPRHDAFWVVYDRESIVKYPDRLHKQAFIKARANGINVVISNVCFESWILLHFQDSVAPYSSYDDLIKNSRLKNHFVDIGFGDYEKGSARIYDFVKTGVELAIERSKKLNCSSLASAAVGKKEGYEICPFTDVYRLLDAIRVFE